MGKTFYFQLHPEGLGTSEVECLVSYIHRLAASHGVTLYQLLAHLRTWRQPRAENRPALLPKQCQSGRWNGYSPDVKVIVQALEAATGLEVLRACTLLALSNVCAANGTGALKLSRAWCPVCYAEAESHESPIYDRLIWQIQGIETCHIHGVGLAQTCWNCGDIQRNNGSKTSLSLCGRCEAPLSHRTLRRNVQPKDLYNIQHIISFFEFTSSNPVFEFELGRMTDFCDLMVQRYSRKILMRDLGDVFHKRWYHLKPQLMSMMAISTYFDTSLVSILTNPKDAAAQAGLGFDPIVNGRGSRPCYRDTDRSSRSLFYLESALSKELNAPSLRKVAILAGVSQNYIRYHFPDLVRQLIALTKKQKSNEKYQKTANVLKIIKAEEISPKFSCERERIRWIAKQANTSIHHVRQIRDGRKVKVDDRTTKS